MIEKSTCFAEVIQTSLGVWRSHSWHWKDAPAYGSLVAVHQDSYAVLGMVYAVEMGALNGERHPFPYKLTEQELIDQQPHIFAFLATTFSCITVGSSILGGAVRYQLAVSPPRIHGFVQYVSEADEHAFFSRSDYLHLIFGFASYIGNVDELLLAILTRQIVAKTITEERLACFIQTYSLLQGNDYRRLKLFLGRVQDIFDSINNTAQ